MDVQFNESILIAKSILNFFGRSFKKMGLTSFLGKFKGIFGVSNTAKNTLNSNLHYKLINNSMLMCSSLSLSFYLMQKQNQVTFSVMS